MNRLFSQFPKSKDIFGALRDEDISDLEILNIKANALLFSENYFDDGSLFYVLSGICESKKNNMAPLSDSIIFKFAPFKTETGSFIGLQELMSPKPSKRELTIYAKSDTAVLKIPKNQFLKWMSKYPDIVYKIFSKVLQDQFTKNTLLVNYISYSSNIATACYLYLSYTQYLKSCYPEGYIGNVIILDTRLNISANIGRSARSVDRAITYLKSLDIISVNKAKINISTHQYECLEKHIFSNLEE